ncbi:uncharacterized protein LOC116340386 [Contarinia nasturtii]|uniref:uncharacterized protein LOC116340386 n=1 Tax=Contarinia nasturtii TaxID=265458 RepID=UPI0012D3F30C|nr:uncharacterized protein LOC116340386 [Contarinia nasturtii]
MGRKRRRQEKDTDRMPQEKRCNHNPPETVPTLRITSINDNCLEHIFKKLEFIDLLNMADSSKCFKNALNLAFASHFRGVKVDINSQFVRINELFKVTYKNNMLKCGTGDCTISIHDGSIGLKLLRCFGHLISNLSVYHCDERFQCKVNRYINNYCFTSLTEININWYPKDLKNSFPNIEIVRFQDLNCKTLEAMDDLKTWCPNVQRLEFIESTAINSCRIGHHLSHLQHLKIRLNRGSFTETGLKNVENMLQMNPQLRSLSVSGYNITANYFSSIRSHLQSLESLSIDCRKRTFFNTNDVIQLNALKTFKIHFVDEFCDPLPKIPFVFNQLDTLSIKACQIRIDTNFIHFLKTHRRSLIKLNLSNWVYPNFYPFYGGNDSKFHDAMKLLKKIDMHGCQFSVHQIEEMLKKCKSLDTFVFTPAMDTDLETIRKHIDTEWFIVERCFGTVKIERQTLPAETN